MNQMTQMKQLSFNFSPSNNFVPLRVPPMILGLEDLIVDLDSFDRFDQTHTVFSVIELHKHYLNHDSKHDCGYLINVAKKLYLMYWEDLSSMNHYVRYERFQKERGFDCIN